MSVHMNLKPLLKLGAVIDQFVLKQWAARYRGFARKRFAENSRGGGTWAPLKPSTIRRRRKGRGIGSVASILWNTGTLIGALDFRFTRKGGQLQEFLRGGRGLEGVRVGFGGPGKHPSGKATIAQIAHAHQTGVAKTNLPARPIIVEPPQEVLDAMAGDVVQRWKSNLRRFR